MPTFIIIKFFSSLLVALPWLSVKKISLWSRLIVDGPNKLMSLLLFPPTIFLMAHYSAQTGPSNYFFILPNAILMLIHLSSENKFQISHTHTHIYITKEYSLLPTLTNMLILNQRSRGSNPGSEKNPTEWETKKKTHYSSKKNNYLVRL